MPYHMTHAGKHKRKKEQGNDIPSLQSSIDHESVSWSNHPRRRAKTIETSQIMK
jgi:hypothetical protein